MSNVVMNTVGPLVASGWLPLGCLLAYHVGICSTTHKFVAYWIDGVFALGRLQSYSSLCRHVPPLSVVFCRAHWVRWRTRFLGCYVVLCFLFCRAFLDHLYVQCVILVALALRIQCKIVDNSASGNSFMGNGTLHAGVPSLCCSGNMVGYRPPMRRLLKCRSLSRNYLAGYEMRDARMVLDASCHFDVTQLRSRPHSLYWLRTISLICLFAAACLLSCLVQFTKPVVRIGEAANPGPNTGDPCGFGQEDRDEGWSVRDEFCSPPPEEPPDFYAPLEPSVLESAFVSHPFDYPFLEDGNWDTEVLGEDCDPLLADFRLTLEGDLAHRRAVEHVQMVDPCDGQCGRFTASPKFLGRKCHRVFKHGALGVGYYPDVLPRRTISLEQRIPILNESSRDAIVLRIAPLLDDLLSQPTAVGSTGNSPPSVLDPSTVTETSHTFAPIPPHRSRRSNRTLLRGRHRRRKKRRTMGGQTFVMCPNAGDASFRKAGLWAIDTANANSWKSAHTYLEESAADIILLQETKRLAGSEAIDAERSASRSGWSLLLEPARSTEAGGVSAGVAVAVRSHMGTAKLRLALKKNELEHRVQAAWVGSMCRGGFYFISCYLYCAEGLSSRNLDLLHHIAGVAAALDGPWVIGGDFNIAPDILRASGWLALVRGVIVSTANPTCNDNVYDFFIVRENILPAIRGVVSISDAGFSPHLPSRLFVTVGSRRLQVRRLCAPRRIPAILPFGCLSEHDSTPRFPPVRLDNCSMEDVDAAYDDWLDDMESVAGNLLSLSGQDLRAISGRRAGPRFVMRPALGQLATGQARSSLSSRAWRKVASWLLLVERDLLWQIARHIKGLSRTRRSASAAKSRLDAARRGCLKFSSAADAEYFMG